jgi:predicted PurR-regulated permease PerM
MDQPASSVTAGGDETLARWVASLPPAPFVNPLAGPTDSRFVPISPRVAVLVAAGIVVGLILWMARDSIRPFILGLLFVYLLDPPVRWLVRRGLRRTLAILVVYVVGIVLIVEILALTLTPLVNEVMRLIQNFPQLAAQLDDQLKRLGELYQRLEIPVEFRQWIDSIIASIGQGGGGGAPVDPSFLLPLITGAGPS